MIPTMILVGLLFGRWWRMCLAASAVLWPAILLGDGIHQREDGSLLWVLLGAAFLGAANAAVGAGVHQGILALVRWVRRQVHSRRQTREGRSPYNTAAGMAP